MAYRYAIRRSKAGKTGEQTVYRLTVPPEIARQLDPSLEFTAELTEEGLLYRPVGSEPPEQKLPSWAKKTAARRR